jgi:hypothetical protein
VAQKRLTPANNPFFPAISDGRIEVPSSDSPPTGFRRLRAKRRRGREQPMRDHSGETDRPTGQSDGSTTPGVSLEGASGELPTTESLEKSTGIHLRLARWGEGLPGREDDGLSQGKVLLPEILESLHNEGDQPTETVTQHIEEDREKLTEATAEYLASVFVDPIFTADTRGWETETDLVTEVVDTSEQLEDGVVASLRRLGADTGLSPGAADFTAGVATNLILAPIMGPLDKAETYIEVAGIIIGITLGAHGLAMACAKLLFKRQSEHLFEQGVISLLHGPRTAQPQSDSHAAARHKPYTATDSLHFTHFTRHESVARPTTHDQEQHSVVPPAHLPTPVDAPGTRREPTRSDPLWLCLAFVSKPTASSGAAHTPTTAAERNVTKPIVLPPGDDAFLRTLPKALRGGSVSEVDAQTLETMNDLPAGQHFIVQMEGISFGTSATSGSQTLQHPGCLTGRCVPPDQPRCPCPCSVCD